MITLEKNSKIDIFNLSNRRVITWGVPFKCDRQDVINIFKDTIIAFEGKKYKFQSIEMFCEPELSKGDAVGLVVTLVDE